MSCPPNYIRVDLTVPPYYICLPTRSPTTTAPAPTTTTKKCYNVYAPVLAIYNTQLPLIYETIAFTFDIYTEPIKLPAIIVTGKKRPTVPAEVTATASSILDKLGVLLVNSVRRSFGNVPVKMRKLDKVFEPLCEISYVMVRIIGTIGVRAVIKPVAISSDVDQLSVFLSQGVLGNIHQPTKATTFNILEVPVQFITSPDELTAFVYTLIGK